MYYSLIAFEVRPVCGKFDTDEALDEVLGVDTWRDGEASAERRPFITSNARFEPMLTAAIAKAGTQEQEIRSFERDTKLWDKTMLLPRTHGSTSEVTSKQVWPQ